MRQLRQPAACRALLLVVLGLALNVAAPAGARKAKDLYEQGRKAEIAKNYDRALELYDQSLQRDPQNQRYQLAARRIRFVAAQAHIDQGRRLRNDDQLDEALREFQRAMEIDPSLPSAVQEDKRTRALIEKSRDSPGEKPEDEHGSVPRQGPRGREDKTAALRDAPELRPASTQPIDVTMPDQESKVIFETIGRLAGVNVLFDPEYTGEKISVELRNATLFEALDSVSLLANAGWKPISHNAIFITNGNSGRRLD